MTLRLTELQLDTDLVQQARDKLSDRGLDLEEFIELQLRLALRAQTVLSLEHVMSFGKYQGEHVETIVRADPQYMHWLVTQSQTRTRFNEDVLELIEEMLQLVEDRAEARRRAKARRHTVTISTYGLDEEIPR